jgi:hypothetical protein
MCYIGFVTIALIFGAAEAWIGAYSVNTRGFALSMGLGDVFKKAFENADNLPPVQNPGLTKEAKTVDVEFQPSGKV